VLKWDRQILTKHPERFKATLPNPPPNVWLGTSIENNDVAWRADRLREAPASVRFLSLEPLLGPLNKVSFRDLQWVIVGGESGAGWSDMDLQWARDILWRCRVLRIPFFFKQVAALHPTDEMIPKDLRVREYPEALAPV
jgi:protein gp37